ncbi:hypothetical protein HPB47_023651, partial [Ixodes persulcatus]
NDSFEATWQQRERMAEKDEPNVVITGRLGYLEEFDPDKVEAWPLYEERLNVFFTTHNIVEGACGPTIYAVICSSCVPVNSLGGHRVGPRRPLYTVPRSQQPGETIPNVVTVQRSFSEHCDFGETSSDMLWDRLVCGVRDKGV